MKNKKPVWMSVGIALVLSGCARDRTIEDYNNSLVQQQESQMNALAGNYRGVLFSQTDGSEIAGIGIEVEADRVTIAGNSGPEAQQQAVLKLTVSLDGGDGTARSLTFQNAGLDPTALQFQSSSSVNLQNGQATTAIANLQGTFSGNTLSGTLDAGYPERAGQFSLTLGATAPAVTSADTRVAKENKYLFNSFLATGAFSGYYAGGPSQVHMTIVPSSLQTGEDQNFVAAFLRDRPVDVSVFTVLVDPNGTPHDEGGFFSSTDWDMTDKTLKGSYIVPSAAGQEPTELQLNCSQNAPAPANSWSCLDVDTVRGLMFSGVFSPEGAVQ